MNRYQSNMTHAHYHLKMALADLKRMNRKAPYNCHTHPGQGGLLSLAEILLNIDKVWFKK